MAALTTSEKILDMLAEGKTFNDLRSSYGYTKADFLTAALFGVAELQNEYALLLKKHGRFNIDKRTDPQASSLKHAAQTRVRAL